MKIFFRKNPYRSLEKRIGYTFRNKDLLATALLHRSYRYEIAGTTTSGLNSWVIPPWAWWPVITCSVCIRTSRKDR